MIEERIASLENALQALSASIDMTKDEGSFERGYPETWPALSHIELTDEVPWSFTTTDVLDGTITHGLMLVRNEILESNNTNITNWNDGAISVDTSNLYWFLKFTIDGNAVTCELESGSEWEEAEDGNSGTPTFIVPLLAFELNAAEDAIQSWTQYQRGNVWLSRL